MNRLKSLIYPSGICHPNYGNYVGWSFISNIIVSAESVISTHSMLNALSVNGTEIIRTANYVGKDVIGQIGGLIYMSKIGKKADAEPKKFIMYSNLIQQSSYMITCLTPFFPSYFIYVAGGANIATNIAFTGFGAINAKCIQKLAIGNNIGEVYAKISVLNTLGSSLGMMIGLCIVSFTDQSIQIGLVPILGLGRTYTYQKAVQGLLEDSPH